MRKWHRWGAVIALFLGLYMAASGLVIQSMDLSALLSHAPADDPTMQAIRVGRNGPPNFQVIREGDYDAAPLPTGYDIRGALARVMALVMADAPGGEPIRFVELRMAGEHPIGAAQVGDRIWRIDPESGAMLGQPAMAKMPPLSLPSLRNTVKDWHRGRALGEWGLLLSSTAALALGAMAISGLVMYWRLMAARWRLGRHGPFWLAGGWWRSLHRGVAVVASVFVLILAASGMALSTSSIGVVINRALAHGQRNGLTMDASSPLSPTQVDTMATATLAAWGKEDGGPMRVIRLRSFGGMAQGVIVTGEEEARQIVYNTATGAHASQSEAGYPSTGMPYGWEVTQIAKRIHRGDALGLAGGMAGRWISLLTGMALLYLCVSGAVVYYQLWSMRKKRSLFW